MTLEQIHIQADRPPQFNLAVAQIRSLSEVRSLQERPDSSFMIFINGERERIRVEMENILRAFGVSYQIVTEKEDVPLPSAEELEGTQRHFQSFPNRRAEHFKRLGESEKRLAELLSDARRVIERTVMEAERNIVQGWKEMERLSLEEKDRIVSDNLNGFERTDPLLLLRLEEKQIAEELLPLLINLQFELDLLYIHCPSGHTKEKTVFLRKLRSEIISFKAWALSALQNSVGKFIKLFEFPYDLGALIPPNESMFPGIKPLLRVFLYEDRLRQPGHEEIIPPPPHFPAQQRVKDLERFHSLLFKHNEEESFLDISLTRSLVLPRCESLHYPGDVM